MRYWWNYFTLSVYKAVLLLLFINIILKPCLLIDNFYNFVTVFSIILRKQNNVHQEYVRKHKKYYRLKNLIFRHAE